MNNTIENTLAQLSMPNENNQSEKTLFDTFSLDDVQKLQDDYKTHWNAEKSLREIATPLFRKYNIRSFSDLSTEDKNDLKKADAIKTAFYSIQELVITKTTKKSKLITHKRGQIKLDEKGNKILNSDGTGYEMYEHTETERVDELVEVPFYDYKNNQHSLAELRRNIEGFTVMPDFEKLEQKLCSHIDYNRGLDIIREITKYYVFEDNDKFIERFAMLICNAKAKGLNKHPKYPVMFSLVGEMGKGKGWFATMIKQTYDKQFDTSSSKTSFRRLFGSQFNGVLMTRGFIHFDEKNGIDSTQCEELKTLITEPDVEVMMKYKEPKTVRNLATFFSTTNESIKDVMGLQKDRRLVEFVLKEKTKEIPTSKMDSMLCELWEVMPCEFPNPEKVINELLDESNNTLCENMTEIVASLFTEHSDDFLKNGVWVSIRKMKIALQDMRGNRSQSVVDWCIKNDIIHKTSNGNYYKNKVELDKLLNSYRNACSLNIEPTQCKVDDDIFGGI